MFNVCLGRLVRENATVTVEAKSKEDLQDRLHEVYDKYDGDGWVPDTEWGCEPSDTHVIEGEAEKDSPVDVTLEENDNG